MTLNHQATAFDSFNARNISPTQVAETFIPPNQFKELSKRSHTLLVGPRGSGKTTLLKMLHPSALDGWQHKEADEYRSAIDYTGVFIPSDVMWSAQIGSLGSEKLTKTARNTLSIAAFTTSVLEGFIDAVLFRISSQNRGFRKVEFNKQQEENFARELSKTAKLEPLFFSIKAVKFALADRRNQIHEIASKAEYLPVDKTDEFISSHDFLHINYLSTLLKGVEVFNSLAEEPDARWALLFDELEIAPNDVLDFLLMSLRSTSEKLIFKLSISPYHKEINTLDSAFSAMEGQDYKPIRLWFSNKTESFSFSEQLLISLLRTKLGESADYKKIFGDADITYDDEDGIISEGENDGGSSPRDKYKAGSREHKKFRSLYEHDPSFKRFIDSHKINLNEINKLPDQIRAQYIRKAAPLVHSRLEFRTIRNEKPQSRSRKNPTFYTGADAILAITEGNPRWLIGLVNSLLINITPSGTISRKNQANEISKAANRFRALIKTIPCHSSTFHIKSRGVLSLLDQIGDYFYNNIVIDEFTTDPVGSFTIDSNIDPNMLDAIGRALNAGAIVYIPDSADSVIGSLKGKRFRLSYLLATHYRLPLNQLRPIALSKILINSPNVSTNAQLDLGYLLNE